MNDVSGFGTRAIVRTSITFPLGFTVSEFADDSDPVDSPAINIAETSMGLNGDLISWSSANPVPLTLNVIPGSDSDVNLGTLGNANRVGKNRLSVRDRVTVTIVYPNGATATFKNGKMTSAPATPSVASSGRKKTNTYQFMFESVDTTPGLLDLFGL